MITSDTLVPTALRSLLETCGYHPSLLLPDYRFGASEGEREVALVGFAHQPTDVRSACVAVIRANGDPAQTVLSYRELGAPMLFVCRDKELQWWCQRVNSPQYIDSVSASELARFFHEHRQDFAPEVVYRAKTRGRFERTYQLSFVDIGLMPLVESEIGRALNRLFERVVFEITEDLEPHTLAGGLGQRLLQAIFWLLAAKILRDKSVSSFESVDLSNINDVFHRVGEHYGSSFDWHSFGRKEREALAAAANLFAQFSHLGHVTTESLSYVYENTLISKKMRSDLAIHSTPPYLVDYIVGGLARWIEEIPAKSRHVFEPACGHAAFLVSAMRLLREFLPITKISKTYLRQRLHGTEIDSFALDIARLSLTLADIPNPDHWDLKHVDMFASDILERLAKESMILLANPPFRNFTKAEKTKYAHQGSTVTYINKTEEMLHRTLPYLRPGAVFGVVVPQGFLHSRRASELRRLIAKQFEIAEICLFPDKVFAFSGAESAILLGRRTRLSSISLGNIRYRRIYEFGMPKFRESYTATIDRLVPQKRFIADANSSMLIPDLEEVWEWCRILPKLGDIAKIGRGIEYKSGGNLPRGAQTISPHHFPKAERGFARVTSNLRIDLQPPQVWLSIEPEVIRRPGAGVITGIPQVLVNAARVRRSPWRLKAVIDKEGHAFTKRFLALRPTLSYQLEFLWALCNAPLANAYVYTHTMKRDILESTLRSIPVPRASELETQRVVDAVHAYFNAVAPITERVLMPLHEWNKGCRLLQKVDAEVLRLYGLPPRLERKLLDRFAGWKRPGVPFNFERYFPDDFEPCFPLHIYLSEDYQRSTVGALRARYKPVTDPVISAGLDHALQDFEE